MILWADQRCSYIFKPMTYPYNLPRQDPESKLWTVVCVFDNYLGPLSALSFCFFSCTLFLCSWISILAPWSFHFRTTFNQSQVFSLLFAKTSLFFLVFALVLVSAYVFSTRENPVCLNRHIFQILLSLLLPQAYTSVHGSLHLDNSLFVAKSSGQGLI